MDKVKNRLTKISRANRVPNFDPASSSTSSLKKRSHSISGVLESDHTPSSPVPPPQQLQLLYHGYMCVDDPRSNKEVLGALRAVREGSNTHSPHSISYGNGTLRVAEGDGDALLVCPLHSVALVSDHGRFCCTVIGMRDTRSPRSCMYVYLLPLNCFYWNLLTGLNS